VDKVYVADEGSDTISVISKTTMTVVGTIPLPPPIGRQPHYVSAGADGRFVYVGERGSNVVDVIDTASDLVSARFAGGSPGSKTLAVVPDPAGEVLYAVNRGMSPSQGTLTALEASTGSVRWQLPIDDPGHFLLAPDGRTGVLSHLSGGTITLIDLERRTVVREMSLGAGTEIDALQLSGNGRYVAATVKGANAGVVIADLIEATPVSSVPFRAVPSLTAPSATEPMYIPVPDSAELPAGVIIVDADTQRIVRQFRLPGRGTPSAAVVDGRR
jgi:YVTN family beta-propeller protein